MAQWLLQWKLLQWKSAQWLISRGPSQLPGPTWYLTIICTFHFREYDTLFWPLQEARHVSGA